MLVMCLFVETGCSNLYRGGELGWGGGRRGRSITRTKQEKESISNKNVVFMKLFNNCSVLVSQ